MALRRNFFEPLARFAALALTLLAFAALATNAQAPALRRLRRHQLRRLRHSRHHPPMHHRHRQDRLQSPRRLHQRPRGAAPQPRSPNRQIRRRKIAHLRARQSEPALRHRHHPATVPAGSNLTLTFTYAGLLANEENSPVPGVRAAVINHDSALPAAPRALVPAHRLSFEPLHRDVPPECSRLFRRRRHRQSLRPDADGRKKSHRRQPSAIHLRMRKPRPPRHLRRRQSATQSTASRRRQRQRLRPSLRTPATPPTSPPTSSRAASPSSPTCSAPLHDPDLSLAQLPDGTLRDFAGPGLLLSPSAPGIPKRRPHHRASRRLAMVGQRSSSRDSRRCLDQRRPRALLRIALRRTKRRQRSRPQSRR